MKSRPDTWAVMGAGLSAAAYLLLAYFTPRTEFYQILLLFGLAFLGYWLLVRSKLTLRQGFWIAMALRLLFLPALPALSDDYFRFLWDGTLVLQGKNPFLYLPVALEAADIPGLGAALLARLNSPTYYSVYPPVCQAIFAAGRLIGGDSYLLACMIMRAFLLLAEAGTILLLFRALKTLNLAPQRAWLYAFNPLVIVELTGNLHFEALMICFLLGSLYLLWQGYPTWSAVALGLSIGVKLLPLMFLPFLVVVLGWRKFIYYAAVVALVVLVIFLPFLSAELVDHFFNSLNLYFQKFEFNASLYYLLRWVGYQVVGYNLISLLGPLLSLATTGIICYLAYFKGKGKYFLPMQFLAALSVYLFLAPVVHPWYVTTLVLLACLGSWRYPLVWSAAVIFSYATYRTYPYQENLLFVFLEYLLVIGLLLWEWRRQKNKALIPLTEPAHHG